MREHLIQYPIVGEYVVGSIYTAIIHAHPQRVAYDRRHVMKIATRGSHEKNLLIYIIHQVLDLRSGYIRGMPVHPTHQETSYAIYDKHASQYHEKTNYQSLHFYIH